MAVNLHGRISLDWSSVQKAMRGVQMSVRSFVNVTGRGLYDATARLSQFGTYFAIAAGGVAAWGLKKAGEFEMLKLRLETAMGDALRARKAWDETVDLAIKSPLQLEPLVKARVLLANFGITSTRALRAVGAAAVMTQRQVEDVASAIGSLETEPLRRMGITSRSRSIRLPNGDVETTFRMTALDRFGKAVTVVTKGVDNARLAVLRFFEMKYGGAMERMAKTWVGVWSTFTDAATIAFADVSNALKVQLIPYLDRLNTWLMRGIQTGAFTRTGQQIYRWVGGVLRDLHACVVGFNALSAATRDQLGNILKLSLAFAVAWKAGFVEVVIKSLGYMVMSSKFAFMAFSAALVALGGFLLGFKLGEALQDAFDLSGPLAKALTVQAAFAERMAWWYEAQWEAARAFGVGLKAAFTGDFIGANAARMHMGEITRSVVESLNPARFIDDVRKGWAELDALAKEPDTRSFGERIADGWARLKKEFATAKGWMEDLKWLVPKPIQDLLDSIRVVSATLPEVKLSDGILGQAGGLADDMAAAADEAERLKKLMEPLRGWGIRPLGVGGVKPEPEPAEKAAVVGLPEAPVPGAAVVGLPEAPAPGAAVVAAEDGPVSRRGSAMPTLPGQEWPEPPSVAPPPIGDAVTPVYSIPRPPRTTYFGPPGGMRLQRYPTIPPTLKDYWQAGRAASSLMRGVGNPGTESFYKGQVFDPRSAIGPLIQQQKQNQAERDGGKDGKKSDEHLGAMVNGQRQTNRLLSDILSARAAFSFA